MTFQQYRRQLPLPPTPPASPPAKYATPSSSPPTQTGTLQLRRLSGVQQATQLPKGLRKKKCRRRKGTCPVTCADGHDEEHDEGRPLQSTTSISFTEKDAETAPSTIVTTSKHTSHKLTPPCDLDVSDLCLDEPPSAAICRIIRSLMIKDLLSAGRAACPCRDINILVPTLPVASTSTRCKGKGKARRSSEPSCFGECSSSAACLQSRTTTTITQKDIYCAGLQKRRILGLDDDAQVPRLGESHVACPIGKCGIKRCSMWDALVGGELCDVSVTMHIQPSLVCGLVLPPFVMSFTLHVHEDDITGSSFVCAPELVRAILPRFFGCLEKRMHSVYTLNHPFGRGSPLLSYRQDAPMETDVWKQWAGCPQALQGRRCDPNESKTRIWLLDDGSAEVSLGAECEPDESTIAPPINSSKGKSRSR